MVCIYIHCKGKMAVEVEGPRSTRGRCMLHRERFLFFRFWRSHGVVVQKVAHKLMIEHSVASKIILGSWLKRHLGKNIINKSVG